MTLIKTVALSFCLLSGNTVSAGSSQNATEVLARINIDATVENLLKYSGSGDLNTTELLVQSGVDINSKFGFYGASGIHNASSQGHFKLVEWFINHGVDVDVVDNFGSTPLVWASYNGRNKVVELLLSEGANPNTLVKQGPTALVAAIQSKSIPTIKHLLEYGADINLASPDGLSPIQASQLLNDKKIAALIN